MPRLRRRKRLVFATAVVVSIGISISYVTTNDNLASSLPIPTAIRQPIAQDDLSKPQLRERTSQIISTFENSTTTVQYGYAEDIDDGRGVTAGRAGFTSGTSDLEMVVKRYSQLAPGNNLQPYLPALASVDGSSSTQGLKGFTSAWKTAAEDPRMRQAQDEIYDKLYFNPALKRAQAAGITSAAGKLAIIDTIIQHGEGDDIDGLPAIVKQTIAKDGKSTPKTEKRWLKDFLEFRRQHLLNAADPDTRAGWQESVDRINALQFLIKQDASLYGELSWDVYGDQFELPIVQ